MNVIKYYKSAHTPPRPSALTRIPNGMLQNENNNLTRLIESCVYGGGKMGIQMRMEHSFETRLREWRLLASTFLHVIDLILDYSSYIPFIQNGRILSSPDFMART